MTAALLAACAAVLGIVIGRLWDHRTETIAGDGINVPTVISSSPPLSVPAMNRPGFGAHPFI